jgi:hypothetical protein
MLGKRFWFSEAELNKFKNDSDRDVVHETTLAQMHKLYKILRASAANII